MDKNKKRLYSSVFNSPDGHKVLKDLMDFCHFMQPSYDASNPHNTSFYEGQRRVLLRILAFLKPEDAMNIYNSKDNMIKLEDDIL